MATMTCIEDLRQRSRRKVPKMFFDYVEAGSYAQETLRANRADLEQIKLRQRVLVDVSRRDLTTSIIGETAPLPLALAPIGLAGMQHRDGEIAACRAAPRRRPAFRSRSAPCRYARSRTWRRRSTSHSGSSSTS